MSFLSGESFDGNFHFLQSSVNVFLFSPPLLAALQAVLHNIAHGWGKLSLNPAASFTALGSNTDKAWWSINHAFCGVHTLES